MSELPQLSGRKRRLEADAFSSEEPTRKQNKRYLCNVGSCVRVTKTRRGARRHYFAVHASDDRGDPLQRPGRHGVDVFNTRAGFMDAPPAAIEGVVWSHYEHFCAYCKKNFPNNEALTVHMQRGNHRIQSMPGERPLVDFEALRCDSCRPPKLFKIKRDLQRHARDNRHRLKLGHRADIEDY